MDKDEIIILAQKAKRYCDLLIEQSDSWLSEEEGRKNVEERISQSRKRKKSKKVVKILIVVFLSISFSASMFGKDIDSLFVAYENSKILNTANELLLQLFESGHLSKYNPFSEKQGASFVDATVNGGMALYSADRGDYENAVYYNLKSLALFRELNDSTYIVHKLQNLYVNYASTGQFDKALDCLKESLIIATAIDDKSMIANTLLSMGSLHVHNLNDEQAIESIEKGLAMERQLKDTTKIIWALNSLCNLYLQTDRSDDAQKCVNEVYSLLNEDTRVSVKISCQISMSLIYQKKKEWDKAIVYMDSVLMESEKHDIAEYICISLLHLGDFYLTSGKDLEKAETYLLRSIEESEKYDISENIMLAYDKLYELNKTKNTTLALMYLEKSVALFKELHKEEIQNQINNFNIQYKTNEKELEIERQHSIIQKQAMHRTFLITGIVVCLVILFLLWRMLLLRIKRNHMLAEMNNTKDKFFSIISHDLKNPAIAQRNALQLLMSNSDKWNTELLTQYYGELLKSADGQVELLYNLLNWAQVQSGRMPYVPQQFDLIAALRSDITLIENMSKRKGVILDVRTPEAVIITGDSNMITTVVRNLLTNAVKFTSAGNSVSLYIEPSAKDGYTINVADTGVGMSEEQLLNLFRIDQQRSHKGTGGESGSGLGLIVCKELIEKHGGELHVESEESKGSRFWFTVH
jgi:Signal transduction histidine kinase